jgi:D-arabinose 1-dehydrogenase-like Zn-dependent alcohol dehydrogenase
MSSCRQRVQQSGGLRTCDEQNGPEYLYEALDFVAQGKVKTIVETYPLAEAAKAYDRVAQGKARFRAVLTM